MVSQLISNAFKRRESISMVYIIEQIHMFFEITVSLTTMLHVMKQMWRFKTVEGIPMEGTRVMADKNTVDAYYEHLTTFLPGTLRPFILNADESGFAENTDARHETFVAPSDYPLDHIYIPTDRHMKGSTLVAAIVADGTGLKSLMIIPHFTIERELYFWDMRLLKRNSNTEGTWVYYSPTF
jgi:hypothetical protein